MSIKSESWHDRTATQLEEKAKEYFKKGYRTASLCVYGEPDKPLYAAVMVKRSNLVDEKRFLALTVAEMQQKVKELQKQGYGAAIISATGPAKSPLVAAVFRPMSPVPNTKGDLTANKLAEHNRQAYRDGNILTWADAYGTPDDTRYMAVWQPNTEKVAWNCDALNDSVQTMQARFDAFVSGWARPQHIAITPAQGFLGVFVDTDIGGWYAYGDMTSDGLTAEKAKLKQQGFLPVSIMAQGSGASRRFVGIFATREEVAPREPFIVTPKNGPSAPKIDAIIEGVMKANNIRGAALAVVKDTRLVYAKGYTWAEANYPKVKPTTFFRQASVSKVFASIATYQLIQEGKLVDGEKFTLDTTMQSVLKLKTPNGEPLAQNFDKITIRHLLEMTSGIDKYLVFADVVATQAFKPEKSLPAKPEDLASYCASQPLIGVPGDKSIANYNNGGYMMLGQVVAKMRGASSFEKAIEKSLLKPLGIDRVREARSLIGNQPSDEAHYHATEECLAYNGSKCTDLLFPRIMTSLSVMSPDKPFVPLSYGEANFENLDGAGGLSAAVTDVARVIAAFSVRQNNPMLDDAMITTMLANAAAASADKELTSDSNGNGKAWGFHGFDAVIPVDVAKGIYIGSKGGNYHTSANYIAFLRGGLAYVICWNCASSGDDGTWGDKFINELISHNWGNVDLFEKYDMAAFPASSGSSGDEKTSSSDKKLPSLPPPNFKASSIAPPPKRK